MADETVIAPGAAPGGRRFVGKYRVDGVLGEGAMGVVYSGHDPDIDREVAIKTVHRRLIAASGGEEWLARFAREARAAGRALHPNLVTIFDYLQVDGAPWLVMEKVRSISLEARMRAEPRLGPAEIHAILRQVLAGLGCIHRAGIVHRDLKPANVMLTEDGGVKLTDFGIARLVATEATGAGMVGTPAYMAPEQFAGGEVDARADIYACGVLAYELVAGRKPYQGGGVEALFAAARRGAATPPGAHAPGVPPALDAAILKALSVEPADRFASPAEMAAALAAGLPGAGDAEAVDTLATLSGAAPLSVPPGTATMLMRLSSETMRDVERELIARIGPMGRVIARRAAAESADAEQMIGAVLRELRAAGEDAAMRESMLRLLAAGAGPVGAAIPEGELRRLIELLRPALGPMAQVLAKRRAAKAGSVPELVAALAEDLDDPAERRAFLAAAAAGR